MIKLGRAVTQLVEALHYKPKGSIPDGVMRIFHLHNHSGRTMALGSTQPSTKMSTRCIFWWVKTGGAYSSWQSYHIHVPIA
jgi:hypothetical protein